MRAPDPLRLIVIVAVLAFVGVRLTYYLRNDLAYRVPPQAKGTSAIAGVVVGDDGKPLVGAGVSLRRQDKTPVWRDARSQSDGTFLFESLPGGTYSIDAHLQNFNVNMFAMTGIGYGALSATLTEGQRRDGVTIRIARGGAFDGVVYDEQGHPAAKCYVRAMRRNHFFDESSLSALPLASTDAQGHYRVTGAPPGEYILMAALDPSANRRVYYPDAARVSEAAPLTLTFGQERTHVDLRARAISTAPIAGVVRRPDGTPAAVVVDLIRAGEPEPDHRHLMSTSRADGRFDFPPVPADRYWIVAHAAMSAKSGAEPRAGTPTDALLSGTIDVTSDGRHAAEVQVTVTPGRTVTGIVKFTATPGQVHPTLTNGLVRLMGHDPRTAAQLNAENIHSMVNANGEFSLTGVPPGSYSFAGSYFRDWWVESIAVDGHPMVDGTFVVPPDRDAGGFTVTLTDKPGTVTGTVRDATGQPQAGWTVVVFGTDARSWTWASGRVRTAGTNLDGAFSVRGLAAGDYLVTALAQGQGDRWADLKALEALRASATPLTLATGERKAIDLVARR